MKTKKTVMTRKIVMKKLKNSLLFAYQTKEMKELLRRYGNELCLLDATYKTTRYAIPLFGCQNQANQALRTATLLRLKLPFSGAVYL